MGYYAETICCASNQDDCCVYDIRAVIVLCILIAISLGCTCVCYFACGGCCSHAAAKTQYLSGELADSAVVVSLDSAVFPPVTGVAELASEKYDAGGEM